MLTDINRAADAIALLHRAVGMAPDNQTAWCELARAELTCDEPRNALQAVNHALACDPTDEWPHRVASMALSRLGDHEGAIRAAREAVRLAPHTWQTYVQLADAIDDHPQPPPVRQSLRNEAWTAANRAVELAPQEPRPHSIVGHLALTNNASVQAEQAFREALRLDPSNARALNGLAMANLRRGNLASAAAGFGAAVAADPNDDSARRNVSAAVWDAARNLFWGLAFLAFGVGQLIQLPWLVARCAVFSIGLVAFLGLCARAWRRVPRRLRGYLLRLLLREPWLGATLALYITSLALMAASMVPATYPDRELLAGAAILATFVSGLVRWFGVSRHNRVVAQAGQ